VVVLGLSDLVFLGLGLELDDDFVHVDSGFVFGDFDAVFVFACGGTEVFKGVFAVDSEEDSWAVVKDTEFEEFSGGCFGDYCCACFCLDCCDVLGSIFSGCFDSVSGAAVFVCVVVGGGDCCFVCHV